MPARESFRSWTFDVPRSMFKLEWLNDLSAEELCALLTAFNPG